MLKRLERLASFRDREPSSRKLAYTIRIHAVDPWHAGAALAVAWIRGAKRGQTRVARCDVAPTNAQGRYTFEHEFSIDCTIALARGGEAKAKILELLVLAVPEGANAGQHVESAIVGTVKIDLGIYADAYDGVMDAYDVDVGELFARGVGVPKLVVTVAARVSGEPAPALRELPSASVVRNMESSPQRKERAANEWSASRFKAKAGAIEREPDQAAALTSAASMFRKRDQTASDVNSAGESENKAAGASSMSSMSAGSDEGEARLGLKALVAKRATDLNRNAETEPQRGDRPRIESEVEEEVAAARAELLGALTPRAPKVVKAKEANVEPNKKINTQKKASPSVDADGFLIDSDLESDADFTTPAPVGDERRDFESPENAIPASDEVADEEAERVAEEDAAVAKLEAARKEAESEARQIAEREALDLQRSNNARRQLDESARLARFEIERQRAEEEARALIQQDVLETEQLEEERRRRNEEAAALAASEQKRIAEAEAEAERSAAEEQRRIAREREQRMAVEGARKIAELDALKAKRVEERLRAEEAAAEAEAARSRATEAEAEKVRAAEEHLRQQEEQKAAEEARRIAEHKLLQEERLEEERRRAEEAAVLAAAEEARRIAEEALKAEWLNEECLRIEEAAALAASQEAHSVALEAARFEDERRCAEEADSVAAEQRRCAAETDSREEAVRFDGLESERDLVLNQNEAEEREIQLAECDAAKVAMKIDDEFSDVAEVSPGASQLLFSDPEPTLSPGASKVLFVDKEPTTPARHSPSNSNSDNESFYTPTAPGTRFAESVMRTKSRRDLDDELVSLSICNLLIHGAPESTSFMPALGLQERLAAVRLANGPIGAQHELSRIIDAFQVAIDGAKGVSSSRLTFICAQLVALRVCLAPMDGVVDDMDLESVLGLEVAARNAAFDTLWAQTFSAFLVPKSATLELVATALNSDGERIGRAWANMFQFAKARLGVDAVENAKDDGRSAKPLIRQLQNGMLIDLLLKFDKCVLDFLISGAVDGDVKSKIPGGGVLTFSAGAELKRAISPLANAAMRFGLGKSADALLPKLRATADVCMIPKDALMDAKLRNDIVSGKISATELAGIISRFAPDDFAPQSVDKSVIDAVVTNSQDVVEPKALPTTYVPTTSEGSWISSLARALATVEGAVLSPSTIPRPSLHARRWTAVGEALL